MEKGKEKKGGGGKKTMETGSIEPSSRISISNLLLNSPMPYPSPTVTLQLHCELFWTFIVYANAHAQCDVQHTHTQAELLLISLAFENCVGLCACVSTRFVLKSMRVKGHTQNAMFKRK